tara:strand:- start:427 stop:561 length:135 start_codon:yes stop_codon:yes gene_type:complete
LIFQKTKLNKITFDIIAQKKRKEKKSDNFNYFYLLILKYFEFIK